MEQRVKEAYEELDKYTLKKIFLTRQSVMNEIIKHKGSNSFPMPRSGIRRGAPLPASIPVTQAANGTAEWVRDELLEESKKLSDTAAQKTAYFLNRPSKKSEKEWNKAMDEQKQNEKKIKKVEAAIERIQNAQQPNENSILNAQQPNQNSSQERRVR